MLPIMTVWVCLKSDLRGLLWAKKRRKKKLKPPKGTQSPLIYNSDVLKCLLETLNLQLFLTLTTHYIRATLEIIIFSEPRSSVRAPSDTGSARLNLQTFYTCSLFFGSREGNFVFLAHFWRMLKRRSVFGKL